MYTRVCPNSLDTKASHLKMCFSHKLSIRLTHIPSCLTSVSMVHNPDCCMSWIGRSVSRPITQNHHAISFVSDYGDLIMQWVRPILSICTTSIVWPVLSGSTIGQIDWAISTRLSSISRALCWSRRKLIYFAQSPVTCQPHPRVQISKTTWNPRVGYWEPCRSDRTNRCLSNPNLGKNWKKADDWVSSSNSTWAFWCGCLTSGSSSTRGDAGF